MFMVEVQSVGAQTFLSSVDISYLYLHHRHPFVHVFEEYHQPLFPFWTFFSFSSSAMANPAGGMRRARGGALRSV